ncbi:MAG: SH3 domain-containing protein [Anaerolineae bacterium]
MDDMSHLVTFVVVAGIGFLVLRELVTWYWKLNEIVTLLKGIDQKLGLILSAPREEPQGQHQQPAAEKQILYSQVHHPTGQHEGVDVLQTGYSGQGSPNEDVIGTSAKLDSTIGTQGAEGLSRRTRPGRSVALPLTLMGFVGIGVVAVLMVTTMYGRREAPVTIYARHPDTTLLLAYVRMADENGNWIADLEHGQEVTLLRSDGTNCQIRTEYGQVGWLSCDFLDNVPFVNSPRRYVGPVVSYATRAPAPTTKSSPTPTVIVSLLSRAKTATGYDWRRASGPTGSLCASGLFSKLAVPMDHHPTGSTSIRALPSSTTQAKQKF